MWRTVTNEDLSSHVSGWVLMTPEDYYRAKELNSDEITRSRSVTTKPSLPSIDQVDKVTAEQEVSSIIQSE